MLTMLLCYSTCIYSWIVNCTVRNVPSEWACMSVNEHWFIWQKIKLWRKPGCIGSTNAVNGCSTNQNGMICNKPMFCKDNRLMTNLSRLYQVLSNLKERYYLLVITSIFLLDILIHYFELAMTFMQMIFYRRIFTITYFANNEWCLKQISHEANIVCLFVKMYVGILQCSHCSSMQVSLISYSYFT